MKTVTAAVILAGLISFWNGGSAPVAPFDSLVPLAHITPTYPFDPDDDEDSDRVRPLRSKDRS